MGSSEGDPVAEVEPSASAWHQQTPSKAPSAPCWRLPASKGYTVRLFLNPKVEEGWALDTGPLPQVLSLSVCLLGGAFIPDCTGLGFCRVPAVSQGFMKIFQL